MCYADRSNWTFRFKNIPDQLELVRFSSKKIKDLGFEFKYSLEDMYTEAIDTCKEKGFLPKFVEAPKSIEAPLNGVTH
jgi:bifunctional dihydroflavonol 4-reductase/flavanone 4-reductase